MLFDSLAVLTRASGEVAATCALPLAMSFTEVDKCPTRSFKSQKKAARRAAREAQSDRLKLSHLEGGHFLG